MHMTLWSLNMLSHIRTDLLCLFLCIHMICIRLLISCVNFSVHSWFWCRVDLCVSCLGVLTCNVMLQAFEYGYAPMGSPSRGGGVSWLSLPTPFSPIFVCPSAYRNLSPVLLFTHQLLPTHLQFSSSDCPFCLHRPFTYISLLYKPSFCHFSFSHTFSVPRSRKMLAFWAGRKSCIYAQR